MKKVILFLSVVLLALPSMAQKEVSGVKFPAKETFGTSELVLNGAGVREKFWIDIYAGALYLDKKSSDAKTIIESEKPMAVRLHIVSSLINSKKMIKAVEEGFENSTDGNIAPIEDRINKFIAFFESELAIDDVFDITYQPGIGVVSYRNGIEEGVIKGMDFKKALFGIWLSNRPADDKLKEAMLGK